MVVVTEHFETLAKVVLNLMKVMAHVEMVHIPYKSAGPALMALVSGEVSLSLLPGLTVLPQVKAGRLRALAITSLKRSPALPNLPTVAESALPGFEASQWYGVLVPAGTPQAIISKLNAALVKGVRTNEFTQRLLNEASIPVGGTPESFSNWLTSEIVKWSKVVKVSGARVE